MANDKHTRAKALALAVNVACMCDSERVELK